MNPSQRGQRSIEATLAVQFGVVSRGQALARGMTRRQIDGSIERGRWTIELPGVYRDVAVPTSGRQAVMAACLWSAPDGLISCVTAGVLWGLEGIVTAEVHVTVLGERRLRSSRVKVHRVAQHLLVDVAAQGRIRVTSAVRTVLDIAGTVDALALELAIEDGLRRGLFSVGQLRWRAGLSPRIPRPLAKLLARDQLGRTESGWELRTARALTGEGLPEPVRQYVVAGVGRLDLAYPEQKTAFEYDSDAWHSGVARRHRDADRRHALRAAGWTVIEVTSALLRTPGCLVALVGPIVTVSS